MLLDMNQNMRSVAAPLACREDSSKSSRPAHHRVPLADGERQQRLWRAVECGDASGVQDALASRASAELRGPSGLTPLMLAAKRRDSECAKILRPYSDLSAKDPRYQTALMMAAANGDASCVEILADSASCAARMFDGATALMLAARECSVPCLEILLKWSDPDAADWDGLTSLMELAMRGFQEGVQLLAPLCDLEAEDSSGKTALDFALACHCEEIADYLAAVARSRSERCELSQANSVPPPMPNLKRRSL